jgi:NADH-quinone oxidoreductase subunit C
VTDIWWNADWYERENYDLLGIEAEGHPDLRRLLLVDEFRGHPLRKDFQEDD